MIKPYPGKFIVLEGIDGSGKSTQSNLLLKRLAAEGYETTSFHFPQHGERSATVVDDYLNGKYGSINEVLPYQAAIFFACDRFDASFRIRANLVTGKIVISDRYVGSHAHQAARIKGPQERTKFYQWVFDLEYNIFKIPQPDISLILKTSPEISFKLLGDKSRDIAETYINHQKNSLDSYLQLAREFPNDFIVIECMEGEKLLSLQIIHEKIWEQVKKVI
jgi:dTMP kinase